MTRSADTKAARFAEAADQHSPGVPAPSRGGFEVPPRLWCEGGSVVPPRVTDSLRELHLFAGAGGGILGGLLLGHTPVCAVEIDAYCRKVLAARQADGWLPEFPIYEDVRQFDGKPWRGRVDVVAGGFPCQPWSQAGKRKGTDDPRHLWPEMARIVEEVRPRYVFAENVQLAAFEEPWRDLRGLGYRVPPALCVAASDVGAPHIRKRWWLLAQLGDPDGFDRSQKHPRHDVIDQQWAQVGRGAVQQSGAGATSGNVSRCSAERTAGGGPGKNVAEGQGAVADADSASTTGLSSGAQAEVARVGTCQKAPTPTAGDAKNARNATSSRQLDSQHHSGTTLCDTVHGTGGKLSPLWVEWLMGWPIGWTDCEPLATDKCRWPQRPLGTT
jgi:site-specific DNA-cytosine methylase